LVYHADWTLGGRENDDWEPLFRHAGKYLEIDQRVHVLNKRMEVLDGMFKMLKDQLEVRHATRARPLSHPDPSPSGGGKSIVDFYVFYNCLYKSPAGQVRHATRLEWIVIWLIVVEVSALPREIAILLPNNQR